MHFLADPCNAGHACGFNEKCECDWMHSRYFDLVAHHFFLTAFAGQTSFVRTLSSGNFWLSHWKLTVLRAGHRRNSHQFAYKLLPYSVHISHTNTLAQFVFSSQGSWPSVSSVSVGHFPAAVIENGIVYISHPNFFLVPLSELWISATFKIFQDTVSCSYVTVCHRTVPLQKCTRPLRSAHLSVFQGTHAFLSLPQGLKNWYKHYLTGRPPLG